PILELPRPARKLPSMAAALFPNPPRPIFPANRPPVQPAWVPTKADRPHRSNTPELRKPPATNLSPQPNRFHPKEPNPTDRHTGKPKPTRATGNPQPHTGNPQPNPKLGKASNATTGEPHQNGLHHGA